MQPTYNRLPGGEILMQSSNRIFSSGIYAHAPAQHTYALGGAWQTLSGQCGIAQQASGSVVFVIQADGEEVWRSQLTKPGQLRWCAC